MEKILKDIAEKSDEHEFFTSLPKDYEVGKTKYIIITGSVMSSVGKGTFTSSLANLLKFYNLKVSPIKFDGYLNVDAGTLNPYRHGEVFVLDDGTECDLDLGSYERLLNEDLSKNNYLTTGKIFKSIIDKERAGKFLGRDVQFIPHVTGEIKGILRSLAIKSKSDIVLVEVGGTVGDLENSYFLEAMRELRYEEGRDNVCFVNVTYILEPKNLGEHKSKAAQLGIRKLMEIGVQPDIIICRSQNPINEKIKEKISIFSNVPVQRVINLYDITTIYDVPIFLKSVKMDKIIFDVLNLEEREFNDEWKYFVEKIKKAEKEITVGIIGKYTEVHDSYLSILNALEHCAPYLNARVNLKWVDTTNLESIKEEFKDVDGIIVPGGFGKRGTEGKIDCIKYARENKIPFLGLCFGFQMALIEYARNVCGLKNANSTEIVPDVKEPVIDLLPEQKKIEGLGGNMRLGGRDIEIKKDTKTYEIYKSEKIRGRFRHRFECNPKYIEVFENNGLIFSGKAPNQPIMQILELKDHPFFMATQFHPEFTSKPLKPSPLYIAFIEACLK